MVALVQDVLNALINEFSPLIDAILNKIVGSVFYIETAFGGAGFALDSLTTLMYSVGYALIVFKFLRKGFSVYILWHDGDADSSPFDLLKSSILAVVFAICFPTMYGWFAEFGTWICDKGIAAAGAKEFSFAELAKKIIGDGISVIGGQSPVLVDAIVFLVMMICCLILWFQFIGRGVELLVLRIGFPIACVGIIDSDGGVFKPYIKLFVQTLFTTVIQVTLLMLTYNLFNTTEIYTKFVAIAVMIAAIKTPKMMQQLLLQVGGGGGITNKIYAGANIARVAGNFIGGK